MKRLAACIAVCLLGAAPAQADGVDDAFVAGRYSEAAALAEAEGGADNLARAARAKLAETVASGQINKADLLKAEALARQALALEPDHPEGRLQLAIALSMLSRDMNTREALDSGNASRGRELAEAVLSDDPDNVYAHGFLAVWNVEVVRRGGSIGSAVMGASMKQAERHYQAALETRADDASLHWQFARALAALNARKYSDEIEWSLSKALDARPKSALDLTMQRRAEAFRDYMETHKRRDVERMAESLL